MIRIKRVWMRRIWKVMFVILLFSCMGCISGILSQESESENSGSERSALPESSIISDISTSKNSEQDISVPESSEQDISEPERFEPDISTVEDSVSDISASGSFVPDTSEEQSVHVHAFMTVQRIAADAYDETVTVTDREAWDETVTAIDSEAWDETVTVTDSDAWDEVITVVDQEAWDEIITVIDEEAYDYISEEIPGYRCRCGAFFSAADDGLDGSAAVNAHQRVMTEQIDAKYHAVIDAGQWKDEMLEEWDAEVAEHGSYADSCEYVYMHVDAVTHDETVHHEPVTHEETVHHKAITHEETVHHEPVFHTEVIHHPAETHTETVHHDAVYETVYVCAECGAVKE